MNLTESCLWGNLARLTPEELLRGFSNSHWWAFAALWWPHSLDSEKQTGWWGNGSGVIYFTTMSLFMGHTTGDCLKCYCPQEKDQYTLLKCYSSLDLLSSCTLMPAPCVCIKPFQGRRHQISTRHMTEAICDVLVFSTFGFLCLCCGFVSVHQGAWQPGIPFNQRCI